VRARRPSPQTVAVLLAFANDPTAWRYGYELGQEVGLKAGSLYPILIRLSDRGLVESSWETGPPSGRPPRHLYRLTDEGISHAAAAQQEAAAVPKEVTEPARAPAAPRRVGEPRGAW
jgi:PadR family transcriptional regulator PadR